MSAPSKPKTAPGDVKASERVIFDNPQMQRLYDAAIAGGGLQVSVGGDGLKLASPSTKKLVTDLKAETNQTEGLKALIARAEKGEFGDFTSPLVAPKLALFKELKDLGLGHLAEKVNEGEYDD